MKKFIFTSNVSSMLNFCNFQSSNYLVSFLKLWEKYDKDSYSKEYEVVEKKLLDNNISTIEKKEKEDILIHCDIRPSQEIIKEYVRPDILNSFIDNLTEKDVVLAKEVLEKEILDHSNDGVQHSDAKKDFILNHVASYANTTHGIIKEDDAIKIYENKYGVVLDTSQNFFYKNISNDWGLGGRLDGIFKSDAESYIVEVKNRSFKFFETTRNYENVQIQLYMYLTDIHKARLVQKYNGEIKVTEIHYNKRLVNKILKALKEYILFFDNFLNSDDTIKGEFMNMSKLNKENYLLKSIINKTNKILFGN